MRLFFFFFFLSFVNQIILVPLMLPAPTSASHTPWPTSSEFNLASLACQKNMIIYVFFVMHTHVRRPNLSPITDSPLCSPKNTSLNFLRGFPKSPPADMVADKKPNLDFFLKICILCILFFFIGLRLSLGYGCAAGSSSPHRMVGMQLVVVLSV